MRLNLNYIINFCLLGSGLCRKLIDIDQELSLCNGIKLLELTIEQVHQHYRNGNLTCTQLTECYLKRISEMNGQLHSVIEINPDAIQIAQELDNKKCLDLPLCGIPILIKDNIMTGDKMETTAGSLALVGAKPKRDAKVVTALRRAGAIILGKTNLSELSGLLIGEIPAGYSGRGGQTKNPYCTNCTMYGSSSGSASAVAANLAIAALGTETIGSLISPSSVNAIVTIKPSHSLVSNEGVIPVVKSLDTVGVMARTTVDAWTISKVIMNNNITETITENKKFRVGVIREPYFTNNTDLSTQLEEMLTRLRRTEVEIIDNLSVNHTELSEILGKININMEFKSSFTNYLKNEVKYDDKNLENKITSLKDMIYRNNELNQTNYKFLLEVNGLLIDPNVLSQTELTKKPVMQLADQLITTHQLDAFIVPSDPSFEGIIIPVLARYPIISLPSGYLKDGTPSGISLFGPINSEPTLVKLAHLYENGGPQIRKSPEFVGFETENP